MYYVYLYAYLSPHLAVSLHILFLRILYINWNVSCIVCAQICGTNFVTWNISFVTYNFGTWY